MSSDNKKNLVLGLDIGGSLTKLGLVSEEGHIKYKTIIKTEAHLAFSKLFTKIQTEVQQLQSRLGAQENIVCIGIGAPNANSLTGNVENPPNLSWDKTTPLKATFEKFYSLPVVIANDANAAALGEMIFGSAKSINNFVLLTLGTGLGSGIIINRKLLIGEHGLAGELGHLTAILDGRECNCGLRGCLETYASVTGIKRTVFELLSQMRQPSRLRKLSFEELSGENISDAALNGDEIAIKAFERTGHILGLKMAEIVAHLDPAAIILSGGLSKAGNLLLKPIMASFDRALFLPYKNKINIHLSQATRFDAILGPAALAWLNVRNREYLLI